MARASSATVEPRVQAEPLSREQLDSMDAYWRAANYLSVGQTVFSTEDSRIYAMTIPTNEELVIARDTYDLVAGHAVSA